MYSSGFASGNHLKDGGDPVKPTRSRAHVVDALGTFQEDDVIYTAILLCFLKLYQQNRMAHILVNEGTQMKKKCLKLYFIVLLSILNY